MTKITKASSEDVSLLIDIYAAARVQMQQMGNANQWIDGYPSQEVIENDIASGNCYLIHSPEMEVEGAFVFMAGPDPNYAQIYEGDWLHDGPYCVIHRVGAAMRGKNIMKKILSWAFLQHPNIRIDTHQDNVAMLGLLQNAGFERCGIIHVSNGTPRIAFQKKID